MKNLSTEDVRLLPDWRQENAVSAVLQVIGSGGFRAQVFRRHEHVPLAAHFLFVVPGFRVACRASRSLADH